MKNIIITGATGAVGKATAFELAKRNNVTLILAGRNLSKLEKLKNELKKQSPETVTDIVEMDLSNLPSVKKASAIIKVKYQQIHAILNIAAVFVNKKNLNNRALETMFVTNHLGPFYFTNELADIIKKTSNARVLTVTAPSSTKIDFDNLNGEKKFSALSAFGTSKMMNLLFAFKLGKEFENGPHASIAFFPGLVKSGLMHQAAKPLVLLLKLISSPPQKAAEAIAKLTMKDDAKTLNGKFFNKNMKELKAPAASYDNNIQDKLWEVSNKITSMA